MGYSEIDSANTEYASKAKRGNDYAAAQEANRIASQIAQTDINYRDIRARIEAIRKHRSAYLMAVGGAAYLVAKAIRGATVVGFADLGMEAIYEFDVRDMPVTVAVDSAGTSVHETGPREWQARIGKIPVTGA